jgi:hypothetical protein
MGRPNAMTDEQREEALIMFIRGASHRKVAEAFSVSPAVIYDLLRDERGRVAARVERSANDVLLELAVLREEAWQSYFDSDKTLTDMDVTETYGSPGEDGAPISECVQKIVKRARKARLKDPRWLAIVQGCIEHEVKIRGLTAPITTRHELRWAGVDPDKIQNEMVRRLYIRVQEILASKAAAAGGVAGNVEAVQPPPKNVEHPDAGHSGDIPESGPGGDGSGPGS